jgi:hypothetical protein
MRDDFGATLRGLERDEEEAPASLPSPPAFASLAPPLPLSPPAPSGHHSLWEAAAAWTPEADPPSPPPEPPQPPPRPSARAEDIAAELDLQKHKTAAELLRARRRVMWDNHPDRRPDLDRELANRRVAMANMLVDRALAALRRRR